MHDIAIGFFNDWNRKVMASKVFLLLKNEYIHKKNIKVYYGHSNFLSKSSIYYKLPVSIILLMRLY